MTTAPVFFLQGIGVVFAASLGQPPSFFGVLPAAVGFGSVVASVLFTRLSSRFEEHMTGTLYIYGASLAPFVALAFLHAAWLAVLLLFVNDLIVTIGEEVTDLVMFKDVPEDYQGRAGALGQWTVYVSSLFIPIESG